MRRFFRRIDRLTRRLLGRIENNYETAPYCGHYHETGSDWWGLVRYHYHEGEGGITIGSENLPYIARHTDYGWYFNPGRYFYRLKKVARFTAHVLDRVPISGWNISLSDFLSFIKIIWSAK